VRGVASGVAAAAAWIVAEPLLQRAFGTQGYSVVRVLGRPCSRRHWRAAGIALHLANGAAAGTAFERSGLRGWKAGVVAFQLEGLATWPGMALVDRVHPDRGQADWPFLFRNARVFGHEMAGHAVFGLVLGLLLPRTAGKFLTVSESRPA
jgi:hypothetical protein